MHRLLCLKIPCMSSKLLYCFYTFLVFIFISCQRELPLCRTPNAYEVRQLKTGDIVFCVGQSMKSDMVRTASNRNAVFSHVGFVVRNDDESMMVHMSADADTIRCESFADYICTSKATMLSFYRISTLTDTGCIQGVLDSLLAKKIPFDYHFDFDDSHELYCTELIVKVAKATGCDVFNSIGNKQYIYPDDLLKVKGLQFLYTINNI